MIGVSTHEASSAWTTPRGKLTRAVMGAREAGVLVRPLAHCIAVSPPLTSEPEHFAMAAQAFGYYVEGRGWPPTTITYYSSVYPHAVDRAAAVWNRTGIGVTFQKAPRSSARRRFRIAQVFWRATAHSPRRS